MSFDIEKRDKVVEVLESVWLTNLKTPSNRTMVADLIIKELFGDEDGYLNNTAYGDNPITPTRKPQVINNKNPESEIVDEKKSKSKTKVKSTKGVKNDAS